LFLKKYIIQNFKKQGIFISELFCRQPFLFLVLFFYQGSACGTLSFITRKTEQSKPEADRPPHGFFSF